MTKKLNQKMIDNIKNYSITTLSSFAEGIRQTIGMYIGHRGNKGYLNMIRELIQNGLDEEQKEDSPGDKVYVRYNETNKETMVADNGRGIPFGDIIRVFTSSHTSSNYNKKKGEYSSGLNGVGAKVTNALSARFTVDSYILGEHRRVEFKKGIPVTEEYDDMKDVPKDAQGTTVTCIPDEDEKILGEITLKAEEVLHLIEKLMPITKIGSEVIFEGIKCNGEVIKKIIKNEDGMITNLIEKTSKPLIAPVRIFKDTGEMKVEAYFTYDSNSLGDEDISSFANFCPTESGTHYKGFVDGLCKYFRNYMNKVYMKPINKKKKNKLTIVNADIMDGLRAIIHVCHLTPLFTGQAKEVLSNEEMAPFVRDTVYEQLTQWFNRYPKDLQKLCKLFKEVAEVRVKAEESKTKLSNNYKSDIFTGLPTKFLPPNRLKNTEIFIVEGDSAKNSASNSRDETYQGVMPIRGKTLNIVGKSKKEIYSNEEISGILAILDKYKDCKLVITADRDPDGSHIATNLSTTIAILRPDVIKEGRLFKALPPLYGVKVGKQMIYFGTRIEYVEYLQDLFSKKNELCINGKALDRKEMSAMAYNNIDYTYELESFARKYALNPKFLESIIKYMHYPFDKLQSILKSIYGKTIDISKRGNYIVINGLVDNVVQTLFVNDKFYEQARYLKDKYLCDPDETYALNGVNYIWLYDIMKAFESTTNVNVTRYKGLGEMNPAEFAKTTLKPENRIWVQYTFDNMKEDIAKLKEYSTTKGKKLLIKGDTARRADLLG